MSGWLHDQALKVSVLLDLLDGEDAKLSHDFRWAPSGPGPAGYEACEVCVDNAKHGHRVCPKCGGTRFVKSRGGAFDPYLSVTEGPVEARDDLSGPQPIYFETRKPDPERMRRQAKVEPPPTEDHIPLTGIEQAASRRMKYTKLLGALAGLLYRAPREIRAGVSVREQAALEWIGRRMSPLPDELLG
jgi:hypothetical protein